MPDGHQVGLVLTHFAAKAPLSDVNPAPFVHQRLGLFLVKGGHFLRLDGQRPGGTDRQAEPGSVTQRLVRHPRLAVHHIPWWTTDIGGFFNGDISTPYFRELIVRWFQYGVFCPLFRLHGYRLPGTEMSGSGGPNEVWSFGERAYVIIRELLFLRQRLRPYIMEQMHLVHEKGVPPMRPLFFDFPEDEDCLAVDDQFMFGPDLLVAPVLYEGARSREVYLPAGTIWTDAWTDETFDGGQWITADAPLERVPLYLRGEARLPIRPVGV